MSPGVQPDMRVHPVCWPLSLVLGIACGDDPEAPADCVERVESWSFTTDQVWDACRVYEVPDGLRLEARLQIAPGTTVRVGNERMIEVLPTGALSAVGTEAEPIVFEGLSANPDFWSGVVILSTSRDNALEWVKMRHTGNSGFLFETFGLVVAGDANDPGYLRMSHLSIGETTENGLDIKDGGEVVMDRIDIDVGGLPARTAFEAGTFFDDNSSFKGRGSDFVRLQRGKLVRQGTLPALNVPWVVQGDRLIVEGVSGRLDVSAGADLRFEQGGTLYIDGGTLSALGTAEAPIRFVGSNPAPGQWDGIIIDSASPDNRMSFVEVGHGGAAASLARFEAANIHLSGTPDGVAARLQLSDALIFASSGDGIRLGPDAVLVTERVSFESIGEQDIFQR